MINHKINYQKYFDLKYCNRNYRQKIKCHDLISFQVKEKESDLLIQASALLYDKALSLLKYYRKILQDYIYLHPLFQTTLRPYSCDSSSNSMISDMIMASQQCHVGPMASVAGCISQYIGQNLLKYSDDLIIENGGDLFIKSSRIRRVMIYAGSSPLSNQFYLEVDSREKSIGVCTSSGTVGPSYSMGKADAVSVLSYSAIVADAAATAVGNIIQSKNDIPKGIDFARSMPDVLGVIIIKDDKIGMWGEIKYGLV